jgi:hypothetical protein
MGNNRFILIDSRKKRLAKEWRHVCVKIKTSPCICLMPQA